MIRKCFDCGQLGYFSDFISIYVVTICPYGVKQLFNIKFYVNAIQRIVSKHIINAINVLLKHITKTVNNVW